jgi:hypothetical protein
MLPVEAYCGNSARFFTGNNYCTGTVSSTYNTTDRILYWLSFVMEETRSELCWGETGLKIRQTCFVTTTVNSSLNSSPVGT